MIINKDRNDFLRYVLFLACALLVAYFIPKKGKFKYEFEEGKPWQHEDLSAPFTFAIYKSNAEVKKEQEEIRHNFKPFYTRDTHTGELKADKLREEVKQYMATDTASNASMQKYLLLRGLQLLEEYYAKGIIKLDSMHISKPRDFIITEVANNVAQDKMLQDYYTLADARNSALERITHDSILNKPWFAKAVVNALDYNIRYDENLSDKTLNELLSGISLTRGVVQQGDKIITRGSIVTPERYQLLNSLRAEYESKMGPDYRVYVGYLVIIVALFLLYVISLEVFNDTALSNTRSAVMVMMNILLFTGMAAFLIWRETANVYVIPFCIIPILLLAFFGIRIAAMTYMLVILVCGMFVPNPFEFILLQTMAGITAILSMARVRYISQFLISALLIFMTYCLVELGIVLIKSSVVQDLDWRTFMWFGGNFILLLLAYPLIYANEKVFGFLSDISLLELADINNKLLKELFLRAPGTFQHSLQVANLAEAVIDRIGGNALLTRVGALYHDVGKLYNPEFFIENQKHNFNPHEGLNDVQSADMIIQHVTRGVEVAQSHRLPRKVIDFIRTHHGTTRVEYFYKHYLQDHESSEVDESVFRYPGPKPSSKEMAVVMMSDSVEAASRSLTQPDDKQIDNLVDRIIDTKIQDNQFDYATITIQEINTSRRILKKLIKSIYHIRIQYPTDAEPKKNLQKF